LALRETLPMPFANPTGEAFTLACVEKNAPAASGVYVLYSTGGFTWKVIYVGESEDIRKSLLGHLGGDNPCIFNQKPAAYMYELIDPCPRALRRKELAMEYDPTCA
jgi:hypothetical protein